MSQKPRNSHQTRRTVKNRTLPVKAAKIVMRKAPTSENRIGLIRIASVHQGDLDGVKGVLHINAVDCFTQWEMVATLHGLTCIRDPARPLPYWTANS